MSTKIFVINLRSSTDRRGFILRQLRKFNISFEFIEAYDSSEISDDELKQANAKKPYAYELTKDEIACAKSHVKALKAAANDTSCTHALVIEDDVYLSKKLPKILSCLSLKDLDGIVLLCSLVFKKLELRHISDICSGHGLVKSDHAKIYGGQAYFLSRKCAKTLSDKLLPITTLADDWDTFLSRKYLSQLFLVYPFPVLHAELLSVRNRPNSAGFRSRVKNLIIKYKLFPFYQLFYKFRLMAAERRQRNNIFAPGFESKKTYKLY